MTLRTDDSVEKYRSKVVQKTLNPVWNESVTIAMPGDGEHLTLVGKHLVFFNDRDITSLSTIGLLHDDVNLLPEPECFTNFSFLFRFFPLFRIG